MDEGRAGSADIVNLHDALTVLARSLDTLLQGNSSQERDLVHVAHGRRASVGRGEDVHAGLEIEASSSSYVHLQEVRDLLSDGRHDLLGDVVSEHVSEEEVLDLALDGEPKGFLHTRSSDMFSTTPMMLMLVLKQKLISLRTSWRATSWGVVTMTAPSRPTSFKKVMTAMCSSEVPGGATRGWGRGSAHTIDDEVVEGSPVDVGQELLDET